MKKHRQKEGTTIRRNYENLANAIVSQAAGEYRRVLGWLSNKPNDRSALSKKQYLEQFFRSGWFGVLTNLEPEALIERIESEVE